ncbi:hypothetical protein GCM10027060_10760 [Nesterenkonia halophila]
MLGDGLALVAHDGDQVLGPQAGGGGERVPDHGHSPEAMQDLRRPRLHAGSGAGGEDDHGGGASLERGHVLMLLDTGAEDPSILSGTRRSGSPGPRPGPFRP